MDDDKLWQMIDEIEHGGKLHAPPYLKEEIFEHIAERESEKRRGKIKKKVFFWGYVLEVSAVTAAAIAFLFTAPLYEMQDYFTNSKQKKYTAAKEQFSDTALDITEKMVTCWDFFLPDKNVEKENSK